MSGSSRASFSASVSRSASTSGIVVVGRGVRLGDGLLAVVDLDAWMNAQDSRVRFGVRGEPVEVEAGVGLVDALVEGF